MKRNAKKRKNALRYGIVAALGGAAILATVLFVPDLTKQEAAPSESVPEVEPDTSETDSEEIDLTDDTEATDTSETSEPSEETTTEATSETTTEEPETTVPAPQSIALGNYNYGEDAYALLRYINDNFPYRVNGNPEVPLDAKFKAAQWIVAQMRSYGYQERHIHYDHSLNGRVWPVDSYTFKKQGQVNKRVIIGAHYDSRESNGCEDNGTGVALLLELAKRFATANPYYTMEFCFWDGEELFGYAGSFSYVGQTSLQDAVLYINLDCLGAGDNLFVYGGEWVGDSLQRIWGYNMAKDVAARVGVPLQSMPDLAEPEFRSPTRVNGSDQYYFAANGIPYVYFEGNAWVDANGVQQYPNGYKSYQYNSKDPAFSDTNGQINHTYHDNLDHLESIFPGRIKSHLTAFSKVVSTMLAELNGESPTRYR